jgi:hypothetical protein
MDNRNHFERQLADEIDYEVGPPQNVDALAITRQAKTTSPRWRFISMSSTIKFAAATSILAVAGAAFFLIAPGGITPDDGDVAPPGAESPSDIPIEGSGSVVLVDNFQCDFGQSWPTRLPACETNDEGTVFTLVFSNPMLRSGPFEGISVLNGTFTGNTAESTFEASGTALFAGEVVDCGAGTIVFDWSGGGTLDENGSPIWETSEYTSVPGGLTLPITATISQLPGEGETRNPDGTLTRTYTTTYTCELPRAE